MLLILLAYFTGSVLCFPLELAIRSSLEDSIRLNSSAKAIDLQSEIYEKLKVQSKLRVLGRVISYIIIPACFFGISSLFQLDNFYGSTGNILCIVLIFGYTIAIQDIVNGLIQIFVVFLSEKVQADGCAKKLVTEVILKEVEEIMIDPTQNVIARVNTTQEPTFTEGQQPAQQLPPNAIDQPPIDSTTKIVPKAPAPIIIN